MTLGPPILRQFLAFAGVGLIATGIQYAILFVGVEGLKLDPVIASSIGFALSALCNYWLNYHFTFRSRKSHLVAGSRFALVASVGLAINAGTMALLVGPLHWPYPWAQLATIVPVLTWNFLANRAWSFSRESNEAVQVAVNHK